MEERPKLQKGLDSKTFRNYYYLKQELVDFCKEEGLSSSGGKLELTERIATYLETGKKTTTITKRVKAIVSTEPITKESIIEVNFVCSQRHRAFFEQEIGKAFSFNVKFQNWLKENAGKTYQDAIVAYAQIKQESKNKTKKIDKQFEYNTYIRDFFADNKGKTLKEVIQCWNYKKSQPGSNAYEKSDLNILS
ncbi:MAG: DUF6434 domain-containing protein [Clostridiales bacterium]|nr:DUF6434 domain-containing protein [Clostridiales bacterium]